MLEYGSQFAIASLIIGTIGAMSNLILLVPFLKDKKMLKNSIPNFLLHVVDAVFSFSLIFNGASDIILLKNRDITSSIESKYCLLFIASHYLFSSEMQALLMLVLCIQAILSMKFPIWFFNNDIQQRSWMVCVPITVFCLLSTCCAGFSIESQTTSLDCAEYHYLNFAYLSYHFMFCVLCGSIGCIMITIFLSLYKKRGEPLTNNVQSLKTRSSLQGSRNSIANQQKIMRQSVILTCIAVSNTVLVTVPNLIFVLVLWSGFSEKTGRNLRFLGLVTNGLRCVMMLPLCVALRQDFREAYMKILSCKKGINVVTPT